MSLITISQDFGSEGYAIAKQVAEMLSLELYDDERLRDEALQEGVSAENLRGLEEKVPGFFDRLLGRKPDVYLDVLQTVVYRVSRSGEGVIVGHGSQMLLKDFGCALHIRIHAPLSLRAEAMAGERGFSVAAAEKIIRKKDEEFKGFFKYAFQMDPNDPGLYDLMVNTAKISADTAARYIADLARSDDAKACSLAALESMERLSLERKIHAELVENGILPNVINVEISQPGVVYVYGVTTTKGEKAKILEIITNMPEVDKVEDSIVAVSRAI